ncbi:MAG TPA: GGDEF domain-containing protein [Solirubrobacteraceae bacterium]|jgi:diguanylate cyclase (GGDEF)-like protein|nr:GGDEF domain-containing protein [Solirubrobacteraceae bacterium]
MPHDTRLLNELAIASLDFPAVICDRDGSLALANAAALRLWPGADEPGDRSFRDLALFCESGEQVAVQRHPLRFALDGEDRVSGRFRVSPDGESWDLTAVALLGERGVLQGAMLTLQPADDSRLRVQDYASDIEIIGEVSRTLASVEDAHEAAAIVSTVTLGSTGACAVLLWRTDPLGELVISHEESVLEEAAMGAVTVQARVGAQRAVAQMGAHIDQSAANDLTLWHEPLSYAGTAIGALSIVWGGAFDQAACLDALTERLQTLIGLLGQQAAVALERAKLLHALNDAARLDSLTGLVNRREWTPSLERELKRARRTHEPLSLVLLDVDHFKKYNDRNGHPAGDRLLADAAAAWAEQLREVDVLARLGGEEFAALLPSCDIDGAMQVAERLRAAMPHGQSCSLGVCVWDERATAGELYAAADRALYRAKDGGRNRVVASLTEFSHSVA